jgi:hypothetical protein
MLILLKVTEISEMHQQADDEIVALEIGMQPEDKPEVLEEQIPGETFCKTDTHLSIFLR